MGIESDVRGVPPAEYGDAWQEHLLGVYQLYVASAEKISDRRQSANSFFLSLDTAVVGLAGFLALEGGAAALYHLLLAIAGMVLCTVWSALIVSYRKLNSAKYAVILEIERALPARPFGAEWTAVGRGEDPRRFRRFTHIEVAVPWVFFAIHAAVFLASLGAL
jgi:hypothetical protein